MPVHLKPPCLPCIRPDLYTLFFTENCFSEGDATSPFGGFKQSGFFGRDKSISAHDQYTELN